MVRRRAISRLQVPGSVVSRMTECGGVSRWVGRNERRVVRSLVGGLNWVNRNWGHIGKLEERVPSLVMSKLAMSLGMTMMLLVMSVMLMVNNSNWCH